MKTFGTLLILGICACSAAAQEGVRVPSDLAPLTSRYKSERRTADIQYANDIIAMNVRYIAALRNLEGAFARRGDLDSALLVRKERESLESEVTALRQKNAEASVVRMEAPVPMQPQEAMAPPPAAAAGKDSIRIVEILPVDPDGIPLGENLLVRAKFSITSVEKASVTLKLSNKGVLFATSLRPFSQGDNEWEFSFNSPTKREADKVELEIRDPRTNRLYARDEKKIRVAWK
jgi:hypothetical protein